MNFKAAKLTNPASWFDDQYQLWLQTHQSRPVCKLPGKKPVQLCVMVEQNHLQHKCNTVGSLNILNLEFSYCPAVLAVCYISHLSGSWKIFMAPGAL